MIVKATRSPSQLKCLVMASSSSSYLMATSPVCNTSESPPVTDSNPTNEFLTPGSFIECEVPTSSTDPPPSSSQGM
ncbi:hypothetical protein BVC80_1273g2 [Macleaya cordata]|uniref:Uncharacterized protein n=1 Tax=Macleaya cordata TaxID=56857 RepID=A0A200PZK9_MACCD|nr:hypothetical protein BVC80_1273g2 [Macleaya cordata]